MNRQTFILLEYILTSGKKHTHIDEFVSLFQVSSRSIYNYWNKITEFLSNIGFQEVVVFDNNEFFFNGNIKDLNKLKSSMSSLSFYEYNLSSQERINIILIILALSDRPIKCKYFVENFCVSRNTIIADLREVRKIARNFEVRFSKNTQKGISIVACERKRREIIFSSLELLNFDNIFFPNSIKNPCEIYLSQYLKFGRYRNIAEKAILYAENEQLMKIPDNHFFKLVLMLIIFINRIKSGYIINDNKNIIANRDDMNFFTTNIFSCLGEELEVLSTEIDYFTKLCFDKNLLSHIIKHKEHPSYTSTLIREMLFHIQPYFNQNLVDDNILNEFLVSHVNLCYRRVTSGKSVTNPYLDNIQIQYNEEFEYLKKFIFIIENGLNISLNNNEIAYILMHILASIKRNASHNRKLNVLVACSAGVATSSLLSALIIKNFHVNIVSTVSIHNINKTLKNHNIDLIISTVPVSNVSVPSVVIDAFLGDNDILKIHKEIINIQNKAVLNRKLETIDKDKCSKHTGISFVDLLSKDLINLNTKVNKWQEAIIVAGEILLWNNNITADYIHEMVNLVEQYGPYIVIAPGVAIAHAEPNVGVIKAGVSVIYLPEAINFGKKGFDPVEVVVACAILDTQEHITAVLQLMSVLREPAFLQMVKKAKKPEDLIGYFENSCQRTNND